MFVKDLLVLVGCYVTNFFCCLHFQVQTLKNPTPDEFRKALDTWQPNLVYLQGQRFTNEEVGSIVWGGVELSSPEAVSGLFSSTMPKTVKYCSLHQIVILFLQCPKALCYTLEECMKNTFFSHLSC